MSERAVHIRIRGRVQGVGFRAWTKRRADEFGLSGWVRNTSAGDVEAVLSGNEGAVAAMLEACRAGPRHASVAAVEVIGPAEIATGGFAVLTSR